MPRTRLVVLLVLALVALVAGPAFSHEPAPAPAPIPVVAQALTETIAAAAPGPSLPWTVIAAVVTMAGVGAWRPRRAVAVALVLVAVVLAFETGVHSTHHLGRADDASQCVVAGVSAHLSANLVDITLDVPRAVVTDTPVTAPAPPAVTARVIAPDAGRAPPAASA